MKIKAGKIEGTDFVDLPKFLASLRRPYPFDSHKLIIGRLYRGYVGVMFDIVPYISLTVWVHKPLAEGDKGQQWAYVRS